MSNNQPENKMQIRRMKRSDLAGLSQFVETLGWNQSPSDLAVFFEQENPINLVATIGGRLVGTVTSMNYHNKLAWIGMMIVEQRLRGHGIGGRLMRSIIRELRAVKCAAIKLDATPRGRPVYQKLGFREECTIFRLIHPAFPGMPKNQPLNITLAKDTDLNEIVRSDQLAFGVSRPRLMHALADNFPEKAYVFRSTSHPLAFALGRAGLRYHQVGPLSAANDEEVKNLLTVALENLAGKAIVLDVLADKTAILEWLYSLGFALQRPLYRMYLDQNPVPGDRRYQYLICGPEFG